MERWTSRTRSDGRSTPRRQAFIAIAFAVTLAGLAWLAWTGMRTRADTLSAGQRAIRVAELRGTITYLDEWTTMSVHMAAVSGEARWVGRYEEAGPRLASAIEEAVALATPEVAAQLESTTEEAHRDLIAMQRAALGLAANGDRGTARALLDSPEYDYLKAVYAAGLDAFGRDLVALSAARTAALNNRAWLEMSAFALCIVLLVVVVLVSLGRTKLKLALAQTERVARTDALTGLPNRREFQEALGQAVAKATRDGMTVAVMLLDLDRFKSVNDTLGHPVGDALLIAVASRLASLIDGADRVARLGGDEFALVVACPCGASDAAALAHRTLSRFGECFVLDEHEVRVGVSIGIALAPAHGTESATLFGRADLALYRAKEDGRNALRFFEEKMEVEVAEREQLELDLRGALGRQEFVLHYQPVVDLASRRMVGCEALIRWQHPTRGLLAPGSFIPLAEATGLMAEIGTWALSRACLDAATWPGDVRVAVNVSAVQVHAGLPLAVSSALDGSGLPPQRLELEVTESVLVQDDASSVEALCEVRRLGVRLALDDFGTGYSSLSYLRRFRFDRVKVDRSFVASLGDPVTVAIVRAIVTLAASLGMSVTAEGVETQDQLSAVRREGCAEAQGYLLGRPAPFDRFAGLLDRETNARAA